MKQVFFPQAARRVVLLTLVAATWRVSPAPATDLRKQLPEAAVRLMDRFPGLHARVDGEGDISIFGRGMYSAETPEKAAAGFLALYGDALGVAAPDLRIEWQVELGSGNATVFAYRQFVENLPVEYGIARLLVYNGPRSAVVYASGRLVNGLPGEGTRSDTDGTAAVAAVRGLPDYSFLTVWSQPQLVVYSGETDGLRRAPQRAWKFSGRTEALPGFRAFSFYVNASTGRLIFARNEVYNAAEIAGRVSAMATPGLEPDTPANPPVELGVPALTVRADSGTSAVTGISGHYVLSTSLLSEDLSAELSGPWVTVRDSLTPLPRLEQSASPPGPADFLFNFAPSEATTAQVNAMIHTSLTHDFFKSRQPSFTGIDLSLNANVNIAANCNAFFTPVGLSINFFNSGGGCVNTAYSSVVAHEYGHFIVNQLSLGQGAFGEGFGDVVAILQYDDPIIGRDFFGPGTFVRDIVGADQQFPCSSENHVCGMVLAGIWWDIKLGLQASLGSQTGLEAARQLFTDWSLITLGGRFRASAHPRTAIEVLTADDNDGDLSNGTPHVDAICDAFAAHNIPCPGSCDALGRVRASCRRGTISMSVSSDSLAGTPITFVLDGSDAMTVTTNGFGRAVARWRSSAPGAHQVCIEDCPGFCRPVTCEP